MGIFIHETAEVSEAASIGEGTKIWNHAQIREGCVIGSNCILSKNVYIDSGVTIGNRVKIQNNVNVYHGVTVEDDVFLGPSMTFTNDFYPRAFRSDWKVRETQVKRGASIGAGAVIICGNTIGEYAMVGAGSVVTRPVNAYALAAGNPAIQIGWVCRCGAKLAELLQDGMFECPECGKKYQVISGNLMLYREEAESLRTGEKMKHIPITKPLIDEEEGKAVREVLSSGWLVQGRKVSQFEQAVADHEQVKYCCATTSCTAALQLSMLASGMTEGMDVIAPSFTFVATANAIAATQATPVLLDVSEDTFNLDPSLIEPYIRENYSWKGREYRNKRTGNVLWGIVPVHQFGLCADMGEINRIAEAYGLTVIEDAACALGARIGKTPIGGFGNTACISFHPRKSITTGEGGMILTNDEELYQKALALRNHGSHISSDMRHEGKGCLLPRYTSHGYNYRMTDIQGAIGCAQMEKLDGILQRRQEIAGYYNELIQKECTAFRAPCVPEGYYHTYQSYVCMLRTEEDASSGRRLRNHIMEELEGMGITVRQGTHAVHKLDYYKETYGYRDKSLPAADRCDSLTISLPVYAAITREEQKYVIDSLRQIWEKSGQ